MNHLINEKCILFDVSFPDKKSVIKSLVENLQCEGYIHDIDTVYEDIIERENLLSTSFGHHVAIPHGRSKGVSRPGICFAKLKEEMIWNEQEEDYVKIVILVVVPTTWENDIYLKVISNLARLLIHEDYILHLIEASKDSVFSILKEGLEVCND